MTLKEFFEKLKEPVNQEKVLTQLMEENRKEEENDEYNFSK